MTSRRPSRTWWPIVGTSGVGSAVAATALLGAAWAALDRKLALPPRRVTRSAALLARTALELRIDQLLTAKGLQIQGAGMRTKLICLRTLVSADLGDRAAVAWGGLSNACHQHAYELSPTSAEVAHLIALVESLSSTHPVSAVPAPGEYGVRA
jgi:hypothetical protein